ncbi:MAG: winged helix DNA-binding protein [Limnochordia bacterium]
MNSTGQKTSLKDISEALNADDVQLMGSDFTCLIGKLMLEIVIYAYSTCREVENVLALVENKLTMTDALVLAHLGGTASAALADISHDLNIPKTTLHYALGKMAERGWIERSSGEQRADQPVFSLTPTGKEQLAQVVRTVFCPTEGTLAYDWIASSHEPLLCLAMILRILARMRLGADYPERVTLAANRIISLVREYGLTSDSISASAKPTSI